MASVHLVHNIDFQTPSHSAMCSAVVSAVENIAYTPSRRRHLARAAARGRAIDRARGRA
eukprot:COSAG02_NODE_502_length_21039_cov_62.499045_27_plen_58_part_01